MKELFVFESMSMCCIEPVLFLSQLLMRRLSEDFHVVRHLVNSPARQPAAQAGLGLVDSMKQGKNRWSRAADCRLAEGELTV